MTRSFTPPTLRTAAACLGLAVASGLALAYAPAAAQIPNIDFSPQPLLEAARALAAGGAVAEATRMIDLNTEFHPLHVPSFAQRAETRLLAADTAGAIAAFEKVLQLQPQNPQAAARLRQLRRPPS
jgi:hypothetical protein